MPARECSKKEGESPQDEYCPNRDDTGRHQQNEGDKSDDGDDRGDVEAAIGPKDYDQSTSSDPPVPMPAIE